MPKFNASLRPRKVSVGRRSRGPDDEAPVSPLSPRTTRSGGDRVSKTKPKTRTRKGDDATGSHQDPEDQESDHEASLASTKRKKSEESGVSHQMSEHERNERAELAMRECLLQGMWRCCYCTRAFRWLPPNNELPAVTTYCPDCSHIRCDTCDGLLLNIVEEYAKIRSNVSVPVVERKYPMKPDRIKRQSDDKPGPSDS